MEPDQQTQKQQVTELLRQAQTLVVTTSKSPNLDEVASVIGLAQMLEKLGKRVEAVISASVPTELSFLPTDTLSNDFSGLRDFVIELDTSQVEADKLKYIPSDQRLKIYITPYNGNFTEKDLGYSYGDYHCDGIIALGVTSPNDLDPAVGKQKQLVDKTKLVAINAGAKGAGGSIVWTEPQASSVCEMLMSLTEALQPGLIDNHIATSLLTGIVAATNHFTGANTTPKVMTMAAQLMAAGADQATIVKNLSQKVSQAETKPTPAPAKASPPAKPQAVQPDNELKPDQEKNLSHSSTKRSRPRHRNRPKTITPPAPNPPPPPTAPSGITPPKPKPAAPPEITQAKPPLPPPPRPAVPPQAKPSPISDVRTPLAGGPPDTSFTVPPPPTPNSGSATSPKLDVESARRAVEEATRQKPPAAAGPPSVPPTT